ncbi:glycosyltransferase, partial [Mycoplasma sp. AC157]
SSERFIDNISAIIEENNVEKVAQRIQKEMQNYDKLTNIGRNAQKCYKNWETVSTDYINHYLEVIERHNKNKKS